MALHLVLGKSGSGKTTFLYDETIRMAGENPAVTYYFIVPEQFSIKTQYDFVTRHPDGGIINIDVTSLARLANKAFTVLHGVKNEALPEIGKSMIIKKVLLDNRDNLQILGRNARRAGFVAEAKAMISEFLQYGVSEADILEMIDEAEAGALKRKLNDAYVLYKGFMGCLESGVHTSEGLYDAFADIAEKAGILKNSVVILDGFTGFTPSQYEILRCFMKSCREVFVSFTADAKAVMGPELKDFDLFKTSQLSVRKMYELADEVKCEISEPYITDFHNPERSDGINAIECGLFRRAVKRVYDDNSVYLYCASSPIKEARFAATEIERLIREENYRYKDIAIVVSDMDVFGEIAGKELEKIGARYFIDRKKSLGENECSGLLMLALKLMEKGADTELLLMLAKNSLSGIARKEAFVLENYCLALGIKGSRFKRSFDRDYMDYGSKKVIISCEAAEAARHRLMTLVSPLLGIKTDKVSNITTCIRKFFTKINLPDQLAGRAEALLKNEDRLRSKEYSKVYEAVDEILTQLDNYLGSEEMTVKEYREVLEAGLAEARVGLVPQGSEQILIGDIERTRLKDIKALFLLGANDGLLPKPSSTKGILTEHDKEILADKGMELSPGMLKKIGRDRFYIYLALSKPLKKLYISYSLRNESEEQSKPSWIIDKIKGLFFNLKINTVEDLPATTRILENDLGHTSFLKIKRDGNVKRLAETEYVKERISAKTAEALYGEKLRGSISKLETYADCPFRFFLTYGIKIKKRDEFTLENADFGNVAHEALENYAKELKEEGLSWFDVPREKRQQLISKCANDAMEKYNNGIFASSDKNKFVSERVEQLVVTTVEALTRQLEGSDFEPYTFEHKFSVDTDLFTLVGKIDRIDVCNKDGLKAVKVIDYKSSPHDFDLTKLYYGQSLQLPVYMQQAREIEELQGFRPAAMLYNEIKNPIVQCEPEYMTEDEETAKAAIDDAIYGEFTAKGLVNSDFEIIKALDHDFADEAGTIADGVTSSKIPVVTKKAGGFSENRCRIATEEEFGLLMDVARAKMKKQAEAIKNGEVSITPTSENGVITGCAYCDYKDVCGFDLKNGGRAKSLRKYSRENIWKKLRGEPSAHEEDKNGGSETDN